MRNLFFIAILFLASRACAQELNARITVNAQSIGSQIKKDIFVSLQNTLSEFVNNRKWTKDNYLPHEKIKCNFLLSVEKDLGNNLFKGRLTVQSTRPVYNATYETVLLNYIDNDVVFKYTEFQPIEFNENRVQGNDPLVANLPAIFAFYANMILAMDASSFQVRGGFQYFQKAMAVVYNAPENKDIIGWKSVESQRNRYWLMEGFNNNSNALIFDAFYSYYKNGLDLMYTDQILGKLGVMNSFNFLSNISTKSPNSMLLQVFFQGKSKEIVKMFQASTSDEKERIYNMVSKIDVSHIPDYKGLR